MPCRCDYMEPTPGEIALEKQSRVNAVLKWDLSSVETYLSSKGMSPTDVSDSVRQYRQMMLEDLTTGSVRRPNQKEDVVLHAHILHTRDFDRFREQAIGSFNHAPEVDYSPGRNAIDLQLLRYAKTFSLSPDEIENDPVYVSGLLKEDWGFLRSYLTSTECGEFEGTVGEAERMVFKYLKSAIAGVLMLQSRTDPAVRLVLESHILHTREFRDFRDRFLGRGFNYEPPLE